MLGRQKRRTTPPRDARRIGAAWVGRVASARSTRPASSRAETSLLAAQVRTIQQYGRPDARIRRERSFHDLRRVDKNARSAMVKHALAAK